MTDDFSYRDPKLSIWQAAAQQVHSRRILAVGTTLQTLRARPVQDRTQDPLMLPAHLNKQVAHLNKQVKSPPLSSSPPLSQLNRGTTVHARVPFHSTSDSPRAAG